MKKIWKARKVDKEKASKIALESGESLILSAIALNRFNKYFEKNGQDFDIDRLADKSMKKSELLEELEKFYTKEKQKEYGVLGIRIAKQEN